MMQASSSQSRKRKTNDRSIKRGDESLCSFCQQTAAAVSVRMPSLRSSKKKGPMQLFCVLHYYTTSAARVDPSDVSIFDQEELDKQLPAIQELFADAFVQLQQELSEESARSFAANQHDPLAILHDLNKKSRKKPSPKQEKKTEKNGGGFLRDVPVPERLIRTQQQQAQQQKELIQRMKQASSKPDVSRRRKSSRKSIWNVVMEQAGDTKKAPPLEVEAAHGAVCSCGSSNVELLDSHTSRRNQEMAKQETWGSKDRNDEVMVRYRCLTCGKTWNEEE